MPLASARTYPSNPDWYIGTPHPSLPDAVPPRDSAELQQLAKGLVVFLLAIVQVLVDKIYAKIINFIGNKKKNALFYYGNLLF